MQTCKELIEQLENEQRATNSVLAVDVTAYALKEKAMQENYPYGAAVAEFFLAFYHYKLSQYEKGKEHALNALTICEKSDGCEKYLIRVCNILGILYSVTDEHFISLEYYLRSYRTAKNVHDYCQQAVVLNNVGDLFNLVENRANSLDYFLRAFKRIERCDGREPLIYSLIVTNIIEVYLLLNETENAEKYIQLAGDMLDKADSEVVECMVLSNKVLLAYNDEDYPAVEKQLVLLLDKLVNCHELTHMFEALLRIRDAVFSLNNSTLFERYCTQISNIVKQTDSMEYRLRYWDVLVFYYTKTQQTERLLAALEQYHAVNLEVSRKRNFSYGKSLASKVQLERALLDRDAFKQRNETLQVLSDLDELTQLLNRRSIKEKIRQALDGLQADDFYAMLVIDVDHFKNINDTYGHMAGDAVLTQLAVVLRESFRGDDQVGRLGGDEFLVFMSGISLDVVSVQQRLCQRLDTMRQAVHSIVLEGFEEIHLSVSVGITLGMGCVPDFAQLYQEADNALYVAKNAGRDCYRFFQ